MKFAKYTNTIITFFSKYSLACIAFLLLSCSAYFFINACIFRARLNVNNAYLFQDNQSVSIVKAIDGDEVLIEDIDGNATRLRLLGIKSFNPTASDPLISEYGKICFSYLSTIAPGKKATLHLSDKKIDDKGRLIGSLVVKNGQNTAEYDLASRLISMGYTLVYTRYDFPQMSDYMLLLNKAMQARAGFWSDEDVAQRAKSLMKLWAEEKRRDD